MDACHVSRICPVAGSVNARPAGAVGAWVSPVAGPYASSSANWAEGLPVLAVKCTRTYRVVVASKEIVADWPPAASKR